MDMDYPPLPSAGDDAKSTAGVSEDTSIAASASTINMPLRPSAGGYRGVEVAANGTKVIYKILSRDGDVALEYTDTTPHASVTQYRWQVRSDNLKRNSPFFSALLDPNKFAEGRHFGEKRTRVKQSSALIKSSNGSKDDVEAHSLAEGLPLVSLNITRLIGKHRIDALELFLKILSWSASNGDEPGNRLSEEIRQHPVSIVAGLVEVADLFNSPQIVRDTLRRARYTPSIKGKISLVVFSPSLLKLSGERVRQIIYIAMFMEEAAIFRVLTHTLILQGSASWVDGVGIQDPASHRWSYLSNGIEEELYYRRQCVLNTITDLQAHFLRAYGALEEDAGHRNQSQNTTTTKTRSIQCRWGFSNSRACDSFHLGEMIRFFSVRTKTIFLGSTLIDPGFDDNRSEEEKEDDEEDEEGDLVTDNSKSTSTTAVDVLAITASLRQIPDYQIDSNHTGCGIRRRLLPVLDCVDGFTGHRRGSLGLTDVQIWKSASSSPTALRLNPNSWKNRGLVRAETVDIRAAKIVNITRQSSTTIPGRVASSSSPRSGTKTPHTSALTTSLPSSRPPSPEEEARLVFTAQSRNWES